MELNELKKLIEEDGSKIIIVENGEPVLVVTSYAEFKANRGSRTKAEAKPKAKTAPALPEELAREDLKIEDLPF